MDDLNKLGGVGEKTVEKLTENGLSSYMNIATSSPSEIADMCGLTENKARAIIKEARSFVSLGFERAKTFAKKRDKIKRIGTGCSDFDEMVGSGFESGAITEVYSQCGCGKTQLSHLLVVRALLENKDNKAIFIDSENTFRADRIKDFAKANNIDENEVLDRIFVARAYNSDHQMLLIDEVEEMLQKNNSYRVLIIDSLTSHFRSEYIGRAKLAERQQKLNKHMHQLLKIADIYNMVVLVTNQVSASPAQMFGDPTTPIGGNIVGHNSTSRIYFRHGKAKCIHATLVDSPNLPKNECDFNITKNGFESVK